MNNQTSRIKMKSESFHNRKSKILHFAALNVLEQGFWAPGRLGLKSFHFKTKQIPSDSFSHFKVGRWRSKLAPWFLFWIVDQLVWVWTEKTLWSKPFVFLKYKKHPQHILISTNICILAVPEWNHNNKRILGKYLTRPAQRDRLLCFFCFSLFQRL